MVWFLKLFSLALVISTGVISLSAADEFVLESHQSKVHVASLRSLPIGPYPTVEGNCAGYLPKDLKQNSKTVDKSGWTVTSQVQYGPFELVSFAGFLESDTSGMCAIEQTNIAIFYMQELIGFFYTDPEIDSALGSMYVNDSGKIEVTSGGGFTSQSFEISFRKNRITLDVPSIKTACEGDGIIPDLNYQSIFQAKKKLLDYGWQPTAEITGSNDFVSYYEKDPYYDTRRINQDLPELITCSGSGIGYCKYLYETDKSYLEIDTVSDGDQVVSFDGFCK